MVDEAHLLRILGRLVDDEAFLSPYGLRSVSRWHREHPYHLQVDGMDASIDYEPAESTTAMFGGNSNWRGPIWFPVNYLVVDALLRFSRYSGDSVTIEYPTGSGEQAHAPGRSARTSAAGSSPCSSSARTAGDPASAGWTSSSTTRRWKDNLLFHEYFHGDDGAGLGASHQTGWTGVVADLIRRSGGAPIMTLADLLPNTTEAPTP